VNRVTFYIVDLTATCRSRATAAASVLQCRAQANTPAAWYWLRRVLDDGAWAPRLDESSVQEMNYCLVEIMLIRRDHNPGPQCRPQLCNTQALSPSHHLFAIVMFFVTVNYCDEYVCLSVCLFVRWHISKLLLAELHSIFCACWLRPWLSSSSGGVAMHYVGRLLPVLLTTSCFHTMDPISCQVYC